MRVTPGLCASAFYRKATAEVIKDLTNGCGAADSIDFVPDTMWGLDVSEACNIHDIDFMLGKTHEDMLAANRTMKNNVQRLIKVKGGWLEKPRLLRSLTYSFFLNHFSGPAFWAGKEGGPVQTVEAPKDYPVWQEH